MEVLQLLNNVHKYRKLKKMTQEELASLVGVTRQTIISIEQGKYIASLPLALKMADIFEVSVEDIFILEDKEK
ncbi:MAG: helix-turn-helix transcriptional regulator [Acholeplasmatales bacterium]|nr:helix-turn-helix transcriptional regulator [Acholeplasmatales bacterium]